MNNEKKIIATRNDQGRTLLKFLLKIFDNVPVSRIYKLLRQKDIKINGKRVSDSKIIMKLDDEVIVYGLIRLYKEEEENKSQIRFNINFEDQNVLVVEKPIGVAIHGDDNCLDKQVLRYLNFKKTDSFTPSHAYRIDKVTSGIVIYGKNYLALRMLKERTKYFQKIYTFKCDLNQSQIVNKKLRHDEVRHKMVLSKDGKKATTEFIIVNNRKKIAILKTGIKHQIRATLSIMGYPIYGDIKYGGKKADRVYLHASEITLHRMTKPLLYLNNKVFKSAVMI